MKDHHPISRRTAVKSSLFGMLTVSIPSIAYAEEVIESNFNKLTPKELFHRYPAIDDELVKEVVGASHFNLNRVQELVNHRPELARATWDWAFGDWETAIGAASHVGRRDIVDFLISKGARPDIFTYAMMGSFQAVKSMIAHQPGVQSIAGPHGISLLKHVENGLRSKDITEAQRQEGIKLLQYLESLGDADTGEVYLEMPAEEQEKYLGDYKYGEGPEDGFSIRLNMRNLLSLGKIGTFGGALYNKGGHVFAYNGTPSVKIEFLLDQGRVTALTVHEPDLSLTAKKVPA